MCMQTLTEDFPFICFEFLWARLKSEQKLDIITDLVHYATYTRVMWKPVVYLPLIVMLPYARDKF